MQAVARIVKLNLRGAIFVGRKRGLPLEICGTSRRRVRSANNLSRAGFFLAARSCADDRRIRFRLARNRNE